MAVSADGVTWDHYLREAINNLTETEIEREADSTLSLPIIMQEQQNNL